MSPARIVAVTRLALDVLEDFDRAQISGKGIAWGSPSGVHRAQAAGRGIDWGSAEGALYQFLNRHQLELQAIHAAAVKEMQALAPRVLAEDAR